MPRMVCGQCRRFLKPKKNGVWIEEGMPVTQRDGSSSWGPYKLWQADLWACRECGVEIVAGFGQSPVAEHYQTDYTAWVERHPPLFRVDDC
jgi:hypothetical protein